MDKLIGEYIDLLNSDADSSEKFWELKKHINNDKNSPGVIVEIKRSVLFQNLIKLIQYGVIDLCELDEFSDELQETVKRLLEA